jgi:hypothetical protein
MYNEDICWIKTNRFYSTRLKNIEDTEKAKRKLMDDTEREEQEPQPQGKILNQSIFFFVYLLAYLDTVPANFEKQIPKQFKPRLNSKLMATDDQAVARFKKRMRK